MVAWYRRSGREFPWRNTGDPYHILAAEMMLRKTSAGLPARVFPEFIRLYPTVGSLARASESRVRRVLQPLGIADRARLMIQTAKAISVDHDGTVPSSLTALLALPGVGPYTANAVRCFAFNQRAPLVDTNVIRVLSRSLEIHSEKRRPRSDRALWAAAEDLVPVQHAREYNLGLLDLGAGICTINNPACHRCPLVKSCAAYQAASPLPSKSIPVLVQISS